MALTQDETLALIQLSRNIEFRYQLDKYEEPALKLLLRSVKKAETEVLNRIEAYAATLPNWYEDYSLQILDSFSDLTLGVRSALEGGVIGMVSEAGVASFLIHNDIVSFGNRVPNFVRASTTSNKLRALVTDVPVGGRLLTDWVQRMYAGVEERIRESVTTGVLKGDDYQILANRLSSEFGMAQREASTLARTYVQSVNNFAQEEVYRQNSDIVKGVKWSAILEPGYKKSGRGTCLRCSILDGQTFSLGEHPSCPLHHNCRCTLLPSLVSWKQLGVNMADIENEYRLYIKTPNEPIGRYGGRTIIDSGLYDKDYASWFNSQDATFKRELLGPNRYELFTSGKVGFKNFIDETGRLKTLKELT